VVGRRNVDVGDGNNRGTYGKLKTDLSKAREFIPRGRKTLSKEIRDSVAKLLKEFK